MKGLQPQRTPLISIQDAFLVVRNLIHTQIGMPLIDKGERHSLPIPREKYLSTWFRLGEDGVHTKEKKFGMFGASKVVKGHEVVEFDEAFRGYIRAMLKGEAFESKCRKFFDDQFGKRPDILKYNQRLNKQE